MSDQDRKGFFVETEKDRPGIMMDFLASVEGVADVEPAFDPSAGKKVRTTDAFEVFVKDGANLDAVGDRIFKHDKVISALKL